MLFFPFVPQTSDEFNQPVLGLQWQWWANFNPDWASLTARPGYLRLAPVSLDKPTLLYNRPNLLLQKFPAESFTVTTQLDLSGLSGEESAGLVLAGKTLSSLTCARTPAGIKVVRTNYNAANPRATADAEETSVVLTPRAAPIVYLRMKVAPRGICTFQLSPAGAIFTNLGNPVTAVNAQWIGAKVGLFLQRPPQHQTLRPRRFRFLPRRTMTLPSSEAYGHDLFRNYFVKPPPLAVRRWEALPTRRCGVRAGA